LRAAFQFCNGVVCFCLIFNNFSTAPSLCPVFGDLAQTHAHRLDGVGGVNDTAAIKERMGTSRAQLRRQD
jgi:hypothetical protein